MRSYNSIEKIFVLMGVLFLTASSVYAETTAEYLKRGNADVSQSNSAKTIPDFTKTSEVNASNVEAYYNRGFVYAKQGDFTQAIVYLQTFLDTSALFRFAL